jgi:hypothetical protein
MSAMKNLIENLRGIEMCMADIKRTMNLNDVDSPLAMHGVSRLDPAPRHNVNSVTDARAIAAELDMHAVAGALDDGQIESISEQVQVDYCELATEISTKGLADYIDCGEIAKHIRPDYVADCIEVSDIVKAMLANPKFMDALSARLVDGMIADQRYLDAVMLRVTFGATVLAAAAAPVPAVRSDADPLTGIEYGTPS